MPTGSKEEAEAAARSLLERGVKQAVLVKRGGSGSLLVTRDGSTEQGIFDAKKVNLRGALNRRDMRSFRCGSQTDLEASQWS